MRCTWSGGQPGRKCLHAALCLLGVALVAYYASWLSGALPAKQGGSGGPFLKDVLGCAQLKKKAEGFVALLKRPNLAKHLGLGGIPGALFHGPDGTGKRMVAQAIANEARGRFVQVDMEQLVIAEFPDGHQILQALFNDSLDSVPTVIFVKRADLSLTSAFHQGEKAGAGDHLAMLRKPAALVPSALKAAGSSEDYLIQRNELLLHSLLKEHELATARGAQARLLLVISTTHKLRRPFGAVDRFEQFHFTNPGTRTRALLFTKKLLPLNLMEEGEGKAKAKAKAGELIGKLAGMTHGLNGRDISKICQRAAMKSLSRDLSEEVARADVEEAAEEVVHEKGVLQAWERKTVAYHEAGHAVVSWRMEHADQMLAVSIVPDNEGALGYTQYDTKGSVLHTDEQVFSKMVVALSGRYSEQHFMNRLTTGARDDLQKVTALAYYSVATYGFDESNMSFEDLASFRRIYSDKIASRIDADAKALIEKAARLAKNMVSSFSDQIDKVAKALLQKDTLRYDDMVELLGASSYVPNDRLVELNLL